MSDFAQGACVRFIVSHAATDTRANEHIGETWVSRFVLAGIAAGEAGMKAATEALKAGYPDGSRVLASAKAGRTHAGKLLAKHGDTLRAAYHGVNDRTLVNVEAKLLSTLFGAGGLYTSVSAMAATFKRAATTGKTDEEKAKASLDKLCAAILTGQYSSGAVAAIQDAITLRTVNLAEGVAANAARIEAQQLAEMVATEARLNGIQHLVDMGMDEAAAGVTYDALANAAKVSGIDLVLPGMATTTADDIAPPAAIAA